MKYKRKIKDITLRVRILRSFLYMYQRVYLGSLRASLTIEAALSLPLILFAMLILMMPLGVINTTRQMQAVAENVCRDASRYAYAFKLLDNNSEDIRSDSLDNKDDEIKSAISGTALGTYAASKARSIADENKLRNISGIKSDFMSDGETITIVLDYSYKLPFSVFGLSDIKQSVTASRRAWIGRDGGLDGTNGEEDDEIVYIGKTSTRYHLSPTCHYIYNDMKKVSLASIDALRNESGGKYYPCGRCGKAASGEVYILPSGGAYHSAADCSAIVAYAKAVKKSTVEHLGACSYCGGK